jgi:hypothetical protein
MPRRKPRPRRTPTQIQALLADYQASGLTRAAFCAAHDLPIATLDAYRRRSTVTVRPSPALNESPNQVSLGDEVSTPSA